MPQLDFTVFINEITWVIIFSSFIYLTYSNYFIPVMFKLIQFFQFRLSAAYNIKTGLYITFCLQTSVFAKKVLGDYQNVIFCFLNL